jgi:hypothetical protein
MGDDAPQISLTSCRARPPPRRHLAAAAMQGSRVRVWLGAVSAGAVVADPYLLFDGEVDQPTLTVGKGTRTLEYDCVSSFERLFDLDEGFRLVDAEHQRIWSGETGLENVTALPRTIYWGAIGRSGSSGGNYGGGGGGGGGGFGNAVRNL